MANPFRPFGETRHEYYDFWTHNGCSIDTARSMADAAGYEDTKEAIMMELDELMYQFGSFIHDNPTDYEIEKAEIVAEWNAIVARGKKVGVKEQDISDLWMPRLGQYFRVGTFNLVRHCYR